MDYVRLRSDILGRIAQKYAHDPEVQLLVSVERLVANNNVADAPRGSVETVSDRASEFEYLSSARMFFEENNNFPATVADLIMYMRKSGTSVPSNNRVASAIIAGMFVKRPTEFRKSGLASTNQPTKWQMVTQIMGAA